MPLNKSLFAALYETLRAGTIKCSETSTMDKHLRLADTYQCTGSEDNNIQSFSIQDGISEVVVATVVPQSDLVKQL